MNNHGFFATLFMSVMGVIFIIGAIALVCLMLYLIIDKNIIKNNGIVIDATITNRSRFSGDNHTDYDIEYSVNGKKYTYYFDSVSNSYNKGDIIKVCCLENNPNKVYVSLEDSRIASSLTVSVFFISLGWACIKNYNIFKYKRVIDVE